MRCDIILGPKGAKTDSPVTAEFQFRTNAPRDPAYFNWLAGQLAASFQLIADEGSITGLRVSASGTMEEFKKILGYINEPAHPEDNILVHNLRAEKLIL